jgi:hypothetical protein
MRHVSAFMLLLAVLACSEARDTLAARTDEARTVGLAFVGALGAGDAAKAAGLAGAR